MTEDEFYLELARIEGRGFRVRLNYLPMIVLVGFGDCFCPITAVCMSVKGRKFFQSRPMACARNLGLSLEVAGQIIKAADGVTGHDPVIRQRLLEALNLTEPLA